MIIRTFKIKTSNNEIVDLQNTSDILTISFNNLGIGFNNSFLNVKNNFILESNKKILNELSLKLLFINPNAYQKYRDFIEKIKYELANSESLKLIYGVTYNNNYNEYYCDVYIKNIGKNELNQFNNLEIDFILEQVSNWKKEIQIEWELIIDTSGGKKYNYKFGAFKYTSIYDQTKKIKNNSDLPAKGEIIINGASINPHIKILKDNKEISECKIYETIKENEAIIINTTIENQKIIKVIKDKNNKIKQEINIYEKQDFNLNTFFTISIGEYKIKYFNDLPTSKLAGSLEIKYYEEYLSV